ncbi:NUDIX hydrolase [Nonomuraea sp. NN258]|uniref:NUDIX hydrolase n=1 Tax=Nonomuraea antri TaxID=2730852 RepID=UPI001568441A|nr:NUDIX hydrolase [Nonomuraea antri]NRQ40056.1 NUDIX hydrolase [Nonomuraea antri]
MRSAREAGQNTLDRLEPLSQLPTVLRPAPLRQGRFPLSRRNLGHVRVNCVGAIIFDASDRLLLIHRGRPPGQGLWSIPGGRLEPGETDEAGVRREVLEETGLRVTVGPLAGTVDLPGPGGATYVIRDYLATVVGGSLTAGDDAADARWYSRHELDLLPLSEGLLECLTDWGVLKEA